MVPQGRRPGERKAQYNLGVMYDNGEGVPKDDAEAVKWYQKAADQGNADARSRLKALQDKLQKTKIKN